MVRKLKGLVVTVIVLAVAFSAAGAASTTEQSRTEDLTHPSAHHLDGEQKGLQEEQECEQEGQQEEDEGEESQKNLAARAKISEEQAKEAAEKATGGTATEVELDEQNGQVVYEVEVGDKEVIVNAENGKIISTDNDSDDDDDDDDDNNSNNN